jgi:hypothetical protein
VTGSPEESLGSFGAEIEQLLDEQRKQREDERARSRARAVELAPQMEAALRAAEAAEREAVAARAAAERAYEQAERGLCDDIAQAASYLVAAGAAPRRLRWPKDGPVSYVPSPAQSSPPHKVSPGLLDRLGIRRAFQPMASQATANECSLGWIVESVMVDHVWIEREGYLQDSCGPDPRHEVEVRRPCHWYGTALTGDGRLFTLAGVVPHDSLIGGRCDYPERYSRPRGKERVPKELRFPDLVKVKGSFSKNPTSVQSEWHQKLAEMVLRELDRPGRGRKPSLTEGSLLVAKVLQWLPVIHRRPGPRACWATTARQIYSAQVKLRSPCLLRALRFQT